MNRLAVTRRQMGLSAGALGLAVVSFMLVASSIARIRGCPAYSATEPKSTEVSNDNPNHLSLLLYNAQLRPRLLFATGQSDRVQQLFPLTEGYDILVVAEAFDDHALNKLKSLYPTGHFSAPLGQNEGLSQDSGLSILSQWPIVLKSQYQKKFDGNCTGSSCFNYQGIITVGIQKDQGPVNHVITAQLQAGNSSIAQSIRQDQYEQVREFIDVMEIPENEPAIFAVSLPISPQTHAAEYEEMIEPIGRAQSNPSPQRSKFAQCALQSSRDGGLHLCCTGSVHSKIYRTITRLRASSITKLCAKSQNLLKQLRLDTEFEG